MTDMGACCSKSEMSYSHGVLDRKKILCVRLSVYLKDYFV